MFNIIISTPVISFINLVAGVIAPLLIIGLWGFGLGCIAKALLVVGLRLTAACSVDEVEVMSLDMAIWHADMAQLPDFDPNEFAIVEEEGDDILATFGAEDLTKWEPETEGHSEVGPVFVTSCLAAWYARIAKDDLRAVNEECCTLAFCSM